MKGFKCHSRAKRNAGNSPNSWSKEKFPKKPLKSGIAKPAGRSFLSEPPPNQRKNLNADVSRSGKLQKKANARAHEVRHSLPAPLFKNVLRDRNREENVRLTATTLRSRGTSAGCSQD